MQNKYIAHQVGELLLPNGFEYREDDNSFINDLCSVQIQDTCYAICDNEGNTYYTSDFIIYTLIGYLTYYGFMSKHYKTP